MTPGRALVLETPTPQAIRSVFGDRAPQARRYAELLRTTGIDAGVLGPREAHGIWQRHVLNCVTLVSLIPPHAVVVDLGSGAGLPGIPIALARPDCQVLLLEPLLRRTRFLEACVHDLELTNVTVVRGRAGGPASGGGTRLPAADVVVARAVAPLTRLVPLALPLLRPGGQLLALKGARAGEELTQAREQGIALQMEHVLATFGGHTAGVVRISRPGTKGSTGART